MAFGIKWLRPELDKLKYYVHIAILVVVVMGVLKFGFNHDMFSLDWFWKISIAVIAGDIAAHSLLKLN